MCVTLSILIGAPSGTYSRFWHLPQRVLILIFLFSLPLELFSATPLRLMPDLQDDGCLSLGIIRPSFSCDVYTPHGGFHRTVVLPVSSILSTMAAVRSRSSARSPLAAGRGFQSLLYADKHY